MEALLHYVWKHKLFSSYPLLTFQGEPIEVIDPGIYNSDAGPDFFNAKIKFGYTVLAGNVEIHCATSDWFKHHHQNDPAYDSIILHVAENIDGALFRKNGAEIPQLKISCPEWLKNNYEELLRIEIYPPCFTIIDTLSPTLIKEWLRQLQTERLEQKRADLQHRLDLCNQNWDDAFFITLARNMGFGVNSDAFELWARCIPLRAVDKHRDDLLQIEAIFMGQAGFLTAEPTDDYHRQLCSEYQYLAQKFSMRPMDQVMWRYMRLHPNNAPQLRIAQLAWFYHQSQGIFSKVLERETLKELYELFEAITTSSYWESHYHFGKVAEKKCKKLSKPTIQLIIVNTVCTFLYAFGKYTANEKLCTRAIHLLHELPAERNRITHLWQACGISVRTAAGSQALIQLKKNYCDVHRCPYCHIGHKYLKRK